VLSASKTCMFHRTLME